MCFDISYNYENLELIDEYFPDIGVDPGFYFDPDISVHVMALGYKRYPIVIKENEKFKLKNFEWSIISEYMNTPDKIKKTRPMMANARSEKILDDKKSYWHRIRSKRCLIPVTGIYEHREIKGWKNKVPYHVSLKDRKLFCIPGLYHYNELLPSDPETGEVRGMFTLITRAANSVMRNIHNGGDNPYRMPLFLPRELELKWLKADLSEDEMREILEYEMPPEQLDYHTVFSLRGRAERPDGKKKNEEFAYQSLPPLGNDDGSLQTSLFG